MSPPLPFAICPGPLPASTVSKRRRRERLRILPRIPGLADISESERLARRWFAAVARGAFDELPQLVHEDVEVVSKIRAGAVVHGRADVLRFIQDTVAPSLYDAAVEVYTPIDADRVIAEGRLRWIDKDRVIRDDPVVWALEFRDELLLRFVAVRTTLAAEAVLGVSR
jgi:ketosteroid isomerase-like protein